MPFTPSSIPAAGILSDAVGAGYLGWNYNPGLIQAGTALTSQSVTMMGLALPPGLSISNIVLNTFTAGTSTVPTGFFVGLAAGGIMLAQSGNLNTDAGLTTLGSNRYALAAAYTTKVSDSPTGLYYVVVLQNGAFAGTNVAFGRAAGNSQNTKANSFGSHLAGVQATGQTSLPANGAACVVGAGGIYWFCGVV